MSPLSRNKKPQLRARRQVIPPPPSRDTRSTKKMKRLPLPPSPSLSDNDDDNSDDEIIDNTHDDEQQEKVFRVDNNRTDDDDIEESSSSSFHGSDSSDDINDKHKITPDEIVDDDEDDDVCGIDSDDVSDDKSDDDEEEDEENEEEDEENEEEKEDEEDEDEDKEDEDEEKECEDEEKEGEDEDKEDEDEDKEDEDGDKEDKEDLQPLRVRTRSRRAQQSLSDSLSRSPSPVKKNDGRRKMIGEKKNASVLPKKQSRQRQYPEKKKNDTNHVEEPKDKKKKKQQKKEAIHVIPRKHTFTEPKNLIVPYNVDINGNPFLENGRRVIHEEAIRIRLDMIKKLQTVFAKYPKVPLCLRGNHQSSFLFHDLTVAAQKKKKKRSGDDDGNRYEGNVRLYLTDIGLHTTSLGPSFQMYVRAAGYFKTHTVYWPHCGLTEWLDIKKTFDITKKTNIFETLKYVSGAAFTTRTKMGKDVATYCNLSGRKWYIDKEAQDGSGFQQCIKYMEDCLAKSNVEYDKEGFIIGDESVIADFLPQHESFDTKKIMEVYNPATNAYVPLENIFPRDCYQGLSPYTQEHVDLLEEILKNTTLANTIVDADAFTDFGGVNVMDTTNRKAHEVLQEIGGSSHSKSQCSFLEHIKQQHRRPNKTEKKPNNRKKNICTATNNTTTTTTTVATNTPPTITRKRKTPDTDDDDDDAAAAVVDDVVCDVQQEKAQEKNEKEKKHVMKLKRTNANVKILPESESEFDKEDDSDDDDDDKQYELNFQRDSTTKNNDTKTTTATSANSYGMEDFYMRQLQTKDDCRHDHHHHHEYLKTNEPEPYTQVEINRYSLPPHVMAMRTKTAVLHDNDDNFAKDKKERRASRKVEPTEHEEHEDEGDEKDVDDGDNNKGDSDNKSHNETKNGQKANDDREECDTQIQNDIRELQLRIDEFSKFFAKAQGMASATPQEIQGYELTLQNLKHQLQKKTQELENVSKLYCSEQLLFSSSSSFSNRKRKRNTEKTGAMDADNGDDNNNDDAHEDGTTKYSDTKKVNNNNNNNNNDNVVAGMRVTSAHPRHNTDFPNLPSPIPDNYPISQRTDVLAVPLRRSSRIIDNSMTVITDFVESQIQDRQEHRTKDQKQNISKIGKDDDDDDKHVVNENDAFEAKQQLFDLLQKNEFQHGDMPPNSNNDNYYMQDGGEHADYNLSLSPRTQAPDFLPAICIEE